MAALPQAGWRFSDGWVTLNMSQASAYQLAVDLSPLNGARIYAVRYVWGVRSPGGEEPLCCAAVDDAHVGLSRPCEPAACPIMASGGLPANPFLATMVRGRCECLSPQECNGADLRLRR